MSKFKDFMSKRWVRSTIVITLMFLIIIGLVIVNLYIPVKYLSAFMSCKGKKREPGEMRVTVLDVGYGDCALVELPDGKNMLIDGGDGHTTNGLTVFSCLHKYDVNKLDYVICTSVNEEHCGGLFDICNHENYEVDTVFLPRVEDEDINKPYKNFIDKVNSKKEEIQIRYCEVGEGVSSDEYDYFFTFLTPAADAAPLTKSNTEEEIDNASASVWLQYGEISMLFAGDLHSDALGNLVQSYNANADGFSFNGNTVDLTSCDILKVGNHGEAASRFAPFYELLKPECAVISTSADKSTQIDEGVLSDIENTVAEDKIFVTGVYKHITISVYGNRYTVL